MALPHLELIASSRERIAVSAERIRRTAARLRVVNADPSKPPPAPFGAHAVMVKDLDGTVISYGWCVPRIDRKAFLCRAWDWAEMIETMPACALHLEP